MRFSPSHRFGLRACLAPLLTLALLWGAELAADTIQLKNGREITGQIIGQNRQEIRVRTGGRTQVISKADVARVRFGETPEQAEARRNAAAESARNKAEQEEEARKQAELEKQKAEEAAQKRAEEEARRKAAEAEQAAQPTTDAGPPGPWSMLWRSALWPGWGHFHADQSLWGWTHTGLFSGALLYGGYAASEANQARVAYDASVGAQLPTALGALAPDLGGLVAFQQLDTQLKYAEFQSKTAQLNQAVGLLGLVYAANLVHAWLSGYWLSTAEADSAAHGSDGEMLQWRFENRRASADWTPRSFSNAEGGRDRRGEPYAGARLELRF